jgi:hypothetical protein
MLDYWLFPLIVALIVVLWAFYLMVKHKGGTGVRTEGRTLVDKPDEENPPTE